MMKIFALVVLIVFVSYINAFRPVSTRANRAMTGSNKHMTHLSMSTVETENVKGAVGSKLTNTDLAIEAIGKFFPDEDAASVDMVATTGGVNNIVQYLTFKDGTKKLLRIYNNGEDTEQVQFEHDVLAKLRAAYPSGFSWEYPNYMQYADSGKTFVKLSNGAEACVVDFIEGTLPKLSCCETIGAASGELNTALATITNKIEAECNCDPYYEMWKIHTAITKENFVETMKGPDFDGELRPFADLMLEETMKITDKCEGEYKALPEQLIHGDLQKRPDFSL
jgi:Ser/Thr protein kinase RdoA (MazF antagonist)